MRKLVVALGLIEQGDNYLLQLRGMNPVIGGAGLIGCFGGKVENETPIQAVSREINEETTLITVEADFEELGSIEVISDHNLETVKVVGHVFRTGIAKTTPIEAREGKLAVVRKIDVTSLFDKMTTGTRACFEELVLKEK